jgi:hypothetical protein
MKPHLQSIKHLFPLCLLVLVLASAQAQPIELKTDDFAVVISDSGQITAMRDPASGKNFVAAGQKAALLRVRVANQWLESDKATFDPAAQVIELSYPTSKVVAQVRVAQKKTHLVFHLVKAAPLEEVEAVSWGPYPTVIDKTIGEVVGVVRDGTYAIGLQALNIKTVGGVLKNAEGADGGRGSTAIKTGYGSSLQAYSMDRSKPRKVSVHYDQYPEMPVIPIPNETVLDSKIALFGCPERGALGRIGEIEVAEGLPHPLIKGVWHKQSPETGRAYLITDFNESNIDKLLAYAQEAGLMSLYHMSAFRSWGHFGPDLRQFPNGIASIKACVAKAEKVGLRLGVHTLTSFIQTQDPYVRPVPDKRLAIAGASVLTAPVDAATQSILVESKFYFTNLTYSTLHAVRIGDEIIRYREVTPNAPYTLLDCQRGAYGTKASRHAQGDTIAMLMDFPYQTLFPNFELQQEIAGNLARFLNETGVSQLDYDGHEGCYSTGQGDYAMQAFAEKIYTDTKHTVVNGTSTSSHYYWHICHYWNWGEPWYGGFRESQADSRLETQPFLERNYMPNMLGWFQLTASTTPEDIEWMMARAGGFHAGFALVATPRNLDDNPRTHQLLGLIKLWQQANSNQVFSVEQRARLKDPGNDFHLERAGNGWKLFPFKKHTFEHVKQVLQPGQPTFSEWALDNNDAPQPLVFVLTPLGKQGVMKNPWIELGGYYKMELPGDFAAGHSIVCDGAQVAVYDEKGSFARKVRLPNKIPVLGAGKNSFKFDCDGDDLKIRFTVKCISSPEQIAGR